MAKERITRRLKVYTTRIGIRDWAVAVPSQKEALKAWDVRENLFASGAAKPVDDPAVIAAALKTPGVPVAAPGQVKPQVPEGKPHEAKSNVVRLDDRRRAKTATDPHKANAIERRAEPKRPERRAALPPDRSKLDAAENGLRELDLEAKVRRKDLVRRKQDLEREADSLETDIATRRRRLERELERARAAYQRAKSS